MLKCSHCEILWEEGVRYVALKLEVSVLPFRFEPCGHDVDTEMNTQLRARTIDHSSSIKTLTFYNF